MSNSHHHSSPGSAPSAPPSTSSPAPTSASSTSSSAASSVPTPSSLFPLTPASVSQISGIGTFETVEESLDSSHSRLLFKVDDRAFLVVSKNTFELRCDHRLKSLLIAKYESVMESRYFGRSGIELVASAHQLSPAEVADLIRLSYRLTTQE